MYLVSLFAEAVAANVLILHVRGLVRNDTGTKCYTIIFRSSIVNVMFICS